MFVKPETNKAGAPELEKSVPAETGTELRIPVTRGFGTTLEIIKNVVKPNNLTECMGNL